MLSIIVPVYNKEKYVGECIKSILNQTFKDFELILVNDGSTDNSAELCRNYAKMDRRIILIDQSNAGVSAARNRGVIEAQGQYIGFIDSDDTIEPRMYELLINNALTQDAEISVCRMQTVFPKKTISPKEESELKKYNHVQGLSNCLKGNLDRSANNKIYIARIAKCIKFEGTMYEDILYTCRAFLIAQSTVVEDKIMYNYIVRDNSASMSKFSAAYMQTIEVSRKMVELVKRTAPECLSEAKEFDITANLSLLNLILLSGKRNFSEELLKIVSTLNGYKTFIKTKDSIRKKHKYALSFFSFSPWLYTKTMYIYCLLTFSEAIERA